MMDTYRDEQIDRFISNEMEPEEHKAFCRELETNEELRKQVKLRGLLAEAEIREAEKQAFRALAAHPAKKRKKLIWSTGHTVPDRQQLPLCPGRYLPHLLCETGNRAVKRRGRDYHHPPRSIGLPDTGTCARCHCLAYTRNTRFGV